MSIIVNIYKAAQILKIKHRIDLRIWKGLRFENTLKSDCELRYDVSGRRLETARRSESIIYTDNILYLVLHFYYTKPQAIKMRDTMYNRLFN